jgi:flagellar hook-length control protein FliK
MISLDLKNETTSSASSPLSLSTSSDEPALSFSELLRGVNEKKDSKTIQNGSLILSLGEDKKSAKGPTSNKESLISLLKNEETLPTLKEEPLVLNSKITDALTTKDIKELISQAKNYLKAKILDSDDFKKSSIKNFPKTLKGLVEVAKNFGIDINKISVEEVKAYSKSNSENIKFLDIKQSSKDEIIQDKKTVTTEIKEIVQEKKTETTDAKEVFHDKKAILTGKKEVSQEPKVKNFNTKAEQIEEVQQLEEIKNDEKITQKKVKSTPLFKAQTATEHTTTEQIVQVKVNSSSKVEQKTVKQKADETLKLLLRGEKPAMRNPALTADFSVVTAKVIAPTATTDISKSLEQLLSGNSSQDDNDLMSKTDGLTTHKADSFEVKLNEAKQMIKYLSNDVKSAIEDYKSPFTRVKVQLNPQRLGEVDLTIVQRGKNLHVNITSNNTAINTLSMNANELRTQLNNSGINNASLNFNNSSQDGNQNASQQQNRQQERQADEEYNYFENEEANEEILSSLEIIVPQYG